MSILRTLAVWAEVALTKRHFKALKRKMDRTEAAAKSARERYEVEVDKPEGLHSRMEAFEEPEIGAPKGYAGDAYQDQVRATTLAIIAADAKARGLPPRAVFDRFGEPL